MPIYYDLDQRHSVLSIPFKTTETGVKCSLGPTKRTDNNPIFLTFSGNSENDIQINNMTAEKKF